jgi:hypothetical protein
MTRMANSRSSQVQDSSAVCHRSLPSIRLRLGAYLKFLAPIRCSNDASDCALLRRAWPLSWLHSIPYTIA